MAGRKRLNREGSVYERKDRGQWVATEFLGWKGSRMDRREFTGATAEEAVARRQVFRDARRDGFTPPKGRPPRVGEWVRHYIYNIIRDKVEATTWEKGYRAKAEMHIIPYFEMTPMPGADGGLDEDMLEEWHRYLGRTRSARTGRPLSASTITQCHRLLSAALNAAVVRKKAPRNPASSREARPPKVTRVEPVPPTEGEIQQILLKCEDRRTGPRWVTQIATGMRQGEILGMLWPSLDIEDPGDASIAVDWELVRLPWKHGCADEHACGARRHKYPCPRPCPKAARTSGRRHSCRKAGDDGLCEPGCTGHASSCPARHSGGRQLKRPKTEHSRARIPLAPYAAAALAQWRTDQEFERITVPAWTGWAHDCSRRIRRGELVCPDCLMPARPGLLVFTQPSGMPVDHRVDWQDWADLLEELGIEHVGTHGNRHALATLLLEHGKDIRVVQELMRHSTPHFTQATYQHVRQQLKKDAVSTIDQVLRGR